ncbi:MAG: hypothetical protein ACJAVX_001386 [Pseudoalteromonas rhizosphaerae]
MLQVITKLPLLADLVVSWLLFDIHSIYDSGAFFTYHYNAQKQILEDTQ